MNDDALEVLDRFKGKALVFTKNTQLAREMRKRYPSATYQYPDGSVGYHFWIPADRVRFYKFLTLPVSRNQVSGGIEIKQLTGRDPSKFAL